MWPSLKYCGWKSIHNRDFVTNTIVLIKTTLMTMDNIEHAAYASMVEVVTLECLRDRELNSYWQVPKTDMKFLCESDLPSYNERFRKYPQIYRDTEDKENFNNLHTLCARDGLMLSNCMAKTFLLRRYEIVKLKLSTATILKIYPGLACNYQIKQEFERVTTKEVQQFVQKIRKLVGNSSRSYFENREMPQYTHQLWKDDATEGPTCATTEMLQAFIFENLDENSVHKLIIYKLAEDEGEVPNRIKRRQPTILINGSIWINDCATVYCDTVKVATGLSFFEAFLSVYFLHYIFEIEYDLKEVKMWNLFDQNLNLLDLKVVPAIDLPVNDDVGN